MIFGFIFGIVGLIFGFFKYIAEVFVDGFQYVLGKLRFLFEVLDNDNRSIALRNEFVRSIKRRFKLNNEL